MRPPADVPVVMRRLYEYLAQRRAWGTQRAGCELVRLPDLPRRRLAEAIRSPVNLPAFRRAMMDGVAICFHTLTAKSDLNIVSDPIDSGTAVTPEVVAPAAVAPAVVAPTVVEQTVEVPAVLVSTGGRVPDWADTVVPVEWLRTLRGEMVTSPQLPGLTVPLRVAQTHVVQAGQHVAAVGEDVRRGQVLLDGSRVVRPQDLGLLAACGLTGAKCFRAPRVALAMTGDEVVPLGQQATVNQVYDANGPVLSAWVQRDGGLVDAVDYLADDPRQLEAYLQRDDVDVIVLCGGTSVGRHDHAARALAAIGQVEFHGLPLRPGRPAAVGQTQSATVFLLPGNPIACQFTYDLLVGPLLRGLAGHSVRWPYRRQPAILAAPVLSQVGRLDYLRVACSPPVASPTASDPAMSTPPTPIARLEGQLPANGAAESAASTSDFRQAIDWGSELTLWDLTPSSPAELPRVWPLTSGRASNLTSVSRADGFVLVPWERSELTANETLQVFWFDA